jgi:integrase
LTPKSPDRYSSIVKNHLIPAIGNIPLTNLRPEDVQRLYTAKLDAGLAPRSVKYCHTVLHKALATALRWNKINRNVADSVEIPHTERHEMQIWNESEIAQFLKTAKATHYYPIFYLALSTGARRGELLALRWSDCDLIGGQISINRTLHEVNGKYVFTQPKSVKSRRSIALPPSASIILRQLRESKEHTMARLGQPVNDSDLIFSNRADNGPLRPNTVSRAWDTLSKQAGVKPIRFHDARHSHASLLLKQGINLKVISERLGHSSIAITADIYSHVSPETHGAAALSFDHALNGRYNEVATES